MDIKHTQDINNQQADVLVVLLEDMSSINSLPDEINTLIKSEVQNLSKQKKTLFKLGTTTLVRQLVPNFSNLLIVGMDSSDFLSGERHRRAAESIHSILKKEFLPKAIVTLSSTDIEDFGAFVEGLQLASYQLEDFKSTLEKSKAELDNITVHFADNSASKKFVHSLTVSKATNLSRKLGDLPPASLTPSIFCKLIKSEIQCLPIEVEVWSTEKLREEKMNGLLNVGKGSSEESKMLILRYNGASKEDPPICLVGKGITFDSGGLDIKSAPNMEGMRYDMCGAATVVAATIAVAQLNIPVNLITYAPLAENLLGPSAAKPGDVYMARNGKSIEIMNTDAEGRLILSDALCLASENSPSLIIDVATLTGAVIAALSNIHTGVFTKSEELLTELKKASAASGEKLWQLPLSHEHCSDMKGRFADLTNLNQSGGAGSATAAAFLSHFVADEIPWVHLDIAGTAQNVGKRQPYLNEKGASGVMVRTLFQLLQNRAIGS